MRVIGTAACGAEFQPFVQEARRVLTGADPACDFWNSLSGGEFFPTRFESCGKGNCILPASCRSAPRRLRQAGSPRPVCLRGLSWQADSTQIVSALPSWAGQNSRWRGPAGHHAPQRARRSRRPARDSRRSWTLRRSAWSGDRASTGVPPQRRHHPHELQRTTAGRADRRTNGTSCQDWWTPGTKFVIGFVIGPRPLEGLPHLVQRRLGRPAVKAVMPHLLQATRQHVLQEPRDERQGGQSQCRIGSGSPPAVAERHLAVLLRHDPAIRDGRPVHVPAQVLHRRHTIPHRLTVYDERQPEQLGGHESGNAPLLQDPLELGPIQSGQHLHRSQKVARRLHPPWVSCGIPHYPAVYRDEVDVRRIVEVAPNVCRMANCRQPSSSWRLRNRTADRTGPTAAQPAPGESFLGVCGVVLAMFFGLSKSVPFTAVL